MKKRLIFIIALLTLMATATSVFAQTEYKPVKINHKITSNNETRYKTLNIKRDSLGSFSSRLSVSTNFIDWALFTPNIGVDIDLGNQNMIGAQSLYFNFKLKPDNKDQFNPFEFWSGRIEYRWHFRWNEHIGQRRGLTRPILGLYNLLTRLDYKSEAMARAMESSQLKRPEMIGGRHYVGIFAEYMDYTLNTKFDLIDRDKIKKGNAIMGGLSLGYEFPAFYNKGHYWQFHLGGNIGVIYTSYDRYIVDKTINSITYNGAQNKILPMVTELKFGMTFRKESISRKYWKPSNKIQMTNIAENREMQALIDSITENYSIATNIFISVPKVNDDLTIKTPLTKKDVIKAIREQSKMPLAAANFVNDTIFPINRLDDYTITYRFKKAINKYSDELEEFTDVIFKFRVELEGRKEAEKLKQSLVDAMQKYRNEKGMPVLYGQAKPKSGDRNELEKYIPWNEVMTLFSRIWGKTVTMKQIKGVSERVGVGIIRPVDEKGINRRSRYTISLSFHPQVEFNYDTDPILSQFEIQFRGEASGLSMYNKINGHRLTLERNYKGGDEFSPEVTAEDIATALKRDGIEVSADNIEVASGQNKFGTRYSAAIYLQAGYVANVSFIVNDKGGLEKAKADFNGKINRWIQSRKWPEIVIKGAKQNPQNIDIPFDDILSAFNAASGYNFKDYQIIDPCVDGEYTHTQDGRYRAYAKIQLHRELTTVPKIPYYITFDNSEAEAKAEAERLEKARLAREKFVSDSIAAAKAEQARLAREKFVSDSIAAAKAELDRLARLAREKAIADSIAAAKAEQARLAREKFVADSIAAAKAELDRLAKLAYDKAVADSIAAAKAELDRLARLAREKAIADSIADANAKQARLVREKFVADSIAYEKAKADSIALVRAKAEEKAKAEAEEKARLEAEEKAKAEAEEKARLEAEELVINNNIVEAEEKIEEKEQIVEEKKQTDEKPKQKIGIIQQKSEYVKPQPKVSINTSTVEEATNDFNTKVSLWIKANKKMPEIIFRGDPVDPKDLVISNDKIVTAFRKASNYVFKEYHFVDYCIGGEYILMSDGRYKAKARLQMHSELETFEVEYYIRFAY